MLVSLKGTGGQGNVMGSVDTFGFTDSGKPLWESDFWARTGRISRNHLYKAQKEGTAETAVGKMLWGWRIVLNKQTRLSWLGKVKVAQSCPTLCNPMDHTVHGILQARILAWVAYPFSRGSSQSRDRTQVSHIAGGFFTSWVTREAQEY